MALSIGESAPDFLLFNSDKKEVTLRDFRGQNVVLLFFPLAFTGVCTKELCAVRDSISIYNEANAKVLGISVDSLYVLNRYKEDQHLNFDLLSDFNKQASTSFGVLYEIFPAFEMRGVSKRAVFVIDKEGVIQFIEICATPGEMPDFSLVQQTLSRLN